MEMVSEKYHIHITSQRKWYDLNLKEVWDYRDLIILFTQRNFTVRYKQTILGPLWIILTPFLTSFIYTFVFGYVAGMSTDGVPHILFYMVSHALWEYFADCLNRNATTFTANAGIFGKVYFPRLVTPISNVLSSIIQFGIQISMAFGVLIFYLVKGEVSPCWSAWLLLPIVIIHLGLLGVGFGLIISSMTTKYRDLTVLIGFGVSLWMYATPVVYPLSQLGEGALKTLILINPVTGPMEIFRFAVIGRGTVIPEFVLLSVLTTAMLDFIGVVIFNQVEKTFMDTV